MLDGLPIFSSPQYQYEKPVFMKTVPFGKVPAMIFGTSIKSLTLFINFQFWQCLDNNCHHH